MPDFHGRRLILPIAILLCCMCGSTLAEKSQEKSQEKSGGDVNELSDDESPKELSVAPLDHVVYPDNRPAWIDGGVVKQRIDEVTFVVVSDPCDTPEESKQELKLMVQATVANFVEKLTGAENMSDFYEISDQRIDSDFTQRSYVGKVSVGGSDQYENAVEILIDQAELVQIMDAWKNVEVAQRMKKLGLGSIGGFAILVISSTAFNAVLRRREQKQVSTADSA